MSLKSILITSLGGLLLSGCVMPAYYPHDRYDPDFVTYETPAHHEMMQLQQMPPSPGEQWQRAYTAGLGFKSAYHPYY